MDQFLAALVVDLDHAIGMIHAPECALALERSLDLVRALEPVLESQRAIARNLDKARVQQKALEHAQECSRALELELERALELERERVREQVQEHVRERTQLRVLEHTRELMKELMQDLELAHDEELSGSDLEPRSLEITIEIPEGTTPERIKEIIRQAALQADALHRSGGGKGLQIDTVKTFREIRVPEGSKK